MNTGRWKEIAELVAVFSIVASLIFVGMQLKQSQDIAIADQYQSRADAALDFYVGRMQSDSALELIAIEIRATIDNGQAPGAIRRSMEDEGPQILAARHLHYRSNITMFDNYHFQYEQGFLTEDAWLGFRRRLTDLLSNDVSAALYEQMEPQFRSSFRETCNQILNEIAEEQTRTNL